MSKSYKQILLILVITLLFSACSVKEPELSQARNSDIEVLATTANDNSFNSTEVSKDFFNKYFKPWNSTKVSFPKLEAMWGQSYKNKKVYLENHQLATSEWFDKQIEKQEITKEEKKQLEDILKEYK